MGRLFLIRQAGSGIVTLAACGTRRIIRVVSISASLKSFIAAFALIRVYAPLVLIRRVGLVAHARHFHSHKT